MYILCKEIIFKCNRKWEDNLIFWTYMEGFFQGCHFVTLLVLISLWSCPCEWIQRQAHLLKLSRNRICFHWCSWWEIMTFSFIPNVGKPQWLPLSFQLKHLKQHTDAHKPPQWRVSASDTYCYTYYSYINELNATDDLGEYLQLWRLDVRFFLEKKKRSLVLKFSIVLIKFSTTVEC